MVRRNRMGAPEAALRGALSGALAGAAMLVAEQIGEATDLARGPNVGRRWASRFGQARRPRRRIVVGWATHIAYSALLGAAYGVVRSRGQLSRPAQGLVASAIAYAAWLPNRTPAPKRGPRVKRLAAQRSPMLYSGALMSGFETLAKR
jgi:PrsW family intramembrane metalloprotease